MSPLTHKSAIHLDLVREIRDDMVHAKGLKSCANTMRRLIFVPEPSVVGQALTCCRSERFVTAKYSIDFVIIVRCQSIPFLLVRVSSYCQVLCAPIKLNPFHAMERMAKLIFNSKGEYRVFLTR